MQNINKAAQCIVSATFMTATVYLTNEYVLAMRMVSTLRQGCDVYGSMSGAGFDGEDNAETRTFRICKNIGSENIPMGARDWSLCKQVVITAILHKRPALMRSSKETIDCGQGDSSSHRNRCCEKRIIVVRNDDHRNSVRTALH